MKRANFSIATNFVLLGIFLALAGIWGYNTIFTEIAATPTNEEPELRTVKYEKSQDGQEQARQQKEALRQNDSTANSDNSEMEPDAQVGMAENIGQTHNAALAYYQANNQLFVDGRNLTLNEYNSALDVLQNYFIEEEGIDVSQVAREAEALTIIFEEMGMFYEESDITYFDSQRMISDQFALDVTNYLVERGVMSDEMANEINQINAMTESDLEPSIILEHVTNDFASRPWSEEERVVAEVFVDVFQHSAQYWSGEPGSKMSKRERRRVILADAAGGVVGFLVGSLFGGLGGPIGAGVGAAACSSLAALMVAPSASGSIGEIHNEALQHYFMSNPFQYREQNLTQSEYTSILTELEEYFITQQDFEAEEVVSEATVVTQVLQDLGMFDEESEETYFDAQRMTSNEFVPDVTAYLVDREAISSHLADEINHINEMTINGTQASMIQEYVTNDFLNHSWSTQDRLVAEAFADVFQHSTEYWTRELESRPRRRFPWHTILADAIGAAQGGALGGPIGAGIGAVVYSVV